MAITTTTPTTPLTLLEAVNTCLKAAGRSQVMSLATADMDEDAQAALKELADTTREVMERGWHFNSETDYPIDPETDGSITLPANAAAVTVSARSHYLDLTQRGNRLYDRGNHTFAVGETVYVDIVFYLEFTDMPGPIRWYATVLAARKFSTGKVPETNQYRFTKEVENDALAKALDFDAESRDVSAKESSPHFARFGRR